MWQKSEWICNGQGVRMDALLLLSDIKCLVFTYWIFNQSCGDEIVFVSFFTGCRSLDEMDMAAASYFDGRAGSAAKFMVMAIAGIRSKFNFMDMTAVARDGVA